MNVNERETPSVRTPLAAARAAFQRAKEQPDDGGDTDRLSPLEAAVQAALDFPQPSSNEEKLREALKQYAGIDGELGDIARAALREETP